MNKIQVNDNVMVRSGKYRTKTGKVNKIDYVLGLVWIEGVNLVKKHQKKSQLHPRGGIIMKQAPMPVSKVMLVDPKSKKATRVSFKDDGKNKQRVAQKSGEVITQIKETNKK